MLNILAHGTWLGWLGVQVPKLPLAIQGEWGLVKRYFRFGTELEKWGRIKGLSSLLPSLSEFSHSICRRVVREMLGVPRHSVGNQSVMLWGVGCSDWEIGTPFQSRSHRNALTRAHFYPCWWITWEFLVFSSCPSSLPFVLPWTGEGCVWWILISKAPGLFVSHSQVAVSLFRMQSGAPFGYLFLYIL